MKYQGTKTAFADPLSYFKLDINNEKIFKQMKTLDWKKIKRYQGTYGIEGLNLLDCFPELQQEIKQASAFYIKKILECDAHFKLTTSWGTMTEPGGSSGRHYHSNAWFSGSYYPQDSSESPIRFHSPKIKLFSFDIKNYNPYTETTWTFSPSYNSLIIFPSYIGHEILLNQSKVTRYSIAFNVFPKGTIGKEDSLITL